MLAKIINFILKQHFVTINVTTNLKKIFHKDSFFLFFTNNYSFFCGRNQNSMKKIVLFASGSGTNAEEIIKYFNKDSFGTVVTVLTNNSDAKVIDKAKKLGVNTLVFNKVQLNEGFILEELNKIKPDLIVLAGFLLMFPVPIIEAYPNKIINIHPALLPKYGGKGMYGMNVHKAIFENKEDETGITIHYVTPNYDEGAIIFQKSVTILDCNSPEEIAQKVHQLEHKHFSKVISDLLNSKF
jgi:phosphoribosylglycinamide formyltransferase-1